MSAKPTLPKSSKISERIAMAKRRMSLHLPVMVLTCLPGGNWVEVEVCP